jgi:hypothetical protein
MVNTFTEHHGGAWSVKDMQHTYVPSFSNCISKPVDHPYVGFSVYFGGQEALLASSSLGTIRFA